MRHLVFQLVLVSTLAFADHRAASCQVSDKSVVGHSHSGVAQVSNLGTSRLDAVSRPSIHILGHPRGRIYNFRPGLTADWSRVFALAAQLDKAVEIDCYPDRQDLSIDLLAIARKEGCRISMGTDAHGPSQLSFMELGMAAVIRSLIRRESSTTCERINCWNGRQRFVTTAIILSNDRGAIPDSKEASILNARRRN